MFAGWVIRNSMDFFVAAFSITLGKGLDIDAEILADLHGIMFAYARGWTNLWLESNSELDVKLLRSNGNNILWRISACWDKLRTIRANINLQVSHVYREGNSIGGNIVISELIHDSLAKLHSDNVWIKGCPDFLLNLAFTDLHRIIFVLLLNL